MPKFERVVPEDSEENNIVLGMIISSEFIKQIQKVYRQEFFGQFYTRTVAKWCMDYYLKYDKAPLTDIKSIFESEKIKIPDPNKAETISIFLERINDKYVEENKKYNVEYYADRALEFFKDASLLSLEEKIRGYRLRADYVQAEAVVSAYQRVEKNIHAGIDVFEDVNEMTNALRFIDGDDSLFSFPGELGKFIRPAKRKDFMAVSGPAARGKSMWLQEIGFLSLLSGNNTILFLFELPKEDFLKRQAKRITGCTESTSGESGPVEISIPFFDYNYERNGMIHQRKEMRKSIELSETLRKMDAVKKISKNKKLKIIYAPENTMSVEDVNSHIENLRHFDNWVPDVIITDYADAMKAKRNDEKRHQIDEIWSGHRSMAQYWDAAVITGTHTKVHTLDKDIKQSDLSEDYRKLNHVTLAFGLNQTDEEQEQGIMRINILKDTRARRRGTYEAVVLQCLDIGQVILDSRVIKKENK
jgi:hypothetical protein